MNWFLLKVAMKVTLYTFFVCSICNMMSSIHVALQELKLLMVMLMKWKQLFYTSRSRHTKTLFLWQQYFSLLCFCYNSLAWNVNTLNNCRCTSQGWCCPLPPMGGPHPWIMRYFSAFFFSLPPSSAPFPPFLTLNSFTEKKNLSPLSWRY